MAEPRLVNAADIAGARRLGATTRLAAIFGDPVSHSLSPVMHNAAYAALGVDRAYVAFHVRPPDLAAAVRAIPALGIVGANITVPHKERAARMVARLSAEARMLGAINCVVNRTLELVGDNTDARGLERDLRSLALALEDRIVIVIGAGGAAGSAIVAALRLGARRIVVANRTPARAQSLRRRLRTRFTADLERVPMDVRGLDALTDLEVMSRAALVINATPMGLVSSGFARMNANATPRNCFFYDLVYAANPTAFIKAAIAAGRPCADGAGMLVNQGELAFELFNGVAPPSGVMRRTIWEKLARPPGDLHS